MKKNQIIVVLIILLAVLIYWSRSTANVVPQPLPSTLVDPKPVMIPVNPATQEPVQQSDIVTVVQN